MKKKNNQLYYLCYYVPREHHKELKKRLFNAGAGSYGEYDQCCWEVSGRGQFRPLSNSRPLAGHPNKLHKLIEYKVEMICQKRYLKKVLKQLKKHHPYEQPAYHLLTLIN